MMRRMNAEGIATVLIGHMKVGVVLAALLATDNAIADSDKYVDNMRGRALAKVGDRVVLGLPPTG
jgi:hypothetical protein